MLNYQAFIIDLGSQVSFHAIYAYDRSFRLAMAQDPSRSWGSVDDRLYNRHIRVAPLTGEATSARRCYTCQSTSHLAAQCPQRSTPSSSGNFAPLSSSANSMVPPFRAPQRGSSYCAHFNFKSCTQSNCQLPHVCAKCGGPHPRPECRRN